MRALLIPTAAEQLQAIALLLGDPDWRPEPSICDDLALFEARFLLDLVAKAGLQVEVHGDRLAISPAGLAPLGFIAALADLHDVVLRILVGREQNGHG